jgi:hypothetical protein
MIGCLVLAVAAATFAHMILVRSRMARPLGAVVRFGLSLGFGLAALAIAVGAGGA